MFKRVLPVLFALTALPAGAATTFYIGTAGEAQFALDLVTRGLTTGAWMDFTGATSGTTLPNVAGTGVTFAGSSSIFVDGDFITLSGFNPVLSLSLPSNVFALGMYITGASPSNRTWTYGPSGGTVIINNSATTFFGVMSTTPLAALPTITLTGPVGGTNGVSVTEFKIGTEALSETPEPSSMALIGSGLLLLPLIARRRVRNRPGAGR